MKEMVNVIKVGKVINPTTFQPQLRCLISFDLEPLKDDSVLYKDGYIEKLFVKELMEKISVKYNEIESIPSTLYLRPAAIEPFPLAIDYEADIEIPQDMIYMHQALRPIVQGNLEMKTYKTDIVLTFDEYIEIRTNSLAFNNLINNIQEFLCFNDCLYFYYACIHKCIKENLDLEFTVAVRGR